LRTSSKKYETQTENTISHVVFGVNDALALKQADCVTAGSGGTDAARGAAALVLTAPACL
jgi:cation transport ATPase